MRCDACGCVVVGTSGVRAAESAAVSNCVVSELESSGERDLLNVRGGSRGDWIVQLSSAEDS